MAATTSATVTADTSAAPVARRGAGADALRRRGQPDLAPCTHPARPGGAVEAQVRVHRPHPRAAVPAVLRVPLRLPEDRPGHRRPAASRGRSPPSPPCSSRRRRPVHHVPGHPGRGDAAGAGVRLHPRDRGPGAGTVPHLARGDLQGHLGRCAGADLRRHRAPHRVGRARRRRGGPDQPALAADPHPRAAVVRLHGVPRPAARDLVRAAQPRPHVRVHRAARSPSWAAPTTSGPAWRRSRPDPSTGCRSSC